MANKHTEKLKEAALELSKLGDHSTMTECEQVLVSVIDSLKITSLIDEDESDDKTPDTYDAHTELAEYKLFNNMIHFVEQHDIMQEFCFSMLELAEPELPSHVTASASWPLKRLNNV